MPIAGPMRWLSRSAGAHGPAGEQRQTGASVTRGCHRSSIGSRWRQDRPCWQNPALFHASAHSLLRPCRHQSPERGHREVQQPVAAALLVHPHQHLAARREQQHSLCCTEFLRARHRWRSGGKEMVPQGQRQKGALIRSQFAAAAGRQAGIESAGSPWRCGEHAPPSSISPCDRAEIPSQGDPLRKHRSSVLALGGLRSGHPHDQTPQAPNTCSHGAVAVRVVVEGAAGWSAGS